MGGIAEEVTVVENVKTDDKCVHKTGVNESHSIFKTYCYKGSHLTMVRVPYSRINGFFMMEIDICAPSSQSVHGMYAGDHENEIVSDTHGLPIYFMETGVRSGKMLSSYMKKFEQYEKNNP